ncbi:MAG: amino acid ABC transporter substrate-binding protein [Proteobacteria bacterium]|nr:amino acid ABC transporter substrate-binding protein [Pseudomonadota bacterium]
MRIPSLPFAVPFAAALSAMLALPAAGPAAAAEAALFPIGYLEITGDHRYQDKRAYARIRIKPHHRPFPGALLALRDSRVPGRAAKVKFSLEKAEAADAAGLVQEVSRLHGEKGVRFFLIDAPAEVLGAVAKATADRDLLLFNVSAPDDALRGAQCRSNLMHVIPSRAMLTDAMAQYLVARKWHDVLLLKGPFPADAALARSFQASARRFGARVIASRDFVPGNDPRERDKNNVALLTAEDGYDVVFIADWDGEFGRTVPFQTHLPRPVVGTEGLIADAWHWTWERHGAPQLNQRFEKLAKRRMDGADWAAWAAVKVVVEAVVRTRSTDVMAVAAYLKGDALTLDGYKGNPSSFRPWDNQLRQPILLHTANAVAARAPIKGFLHPAENMDTLGYDREDKKCRF